jgi:transposase
MKRKMRKTPEPVFKEYNQDQGWLFPPNLNDMVPFNHIVRMVNHIIDQMDLSFLKKMYKGGGSSSYHPKMLLKLLVFAYTQRIYSSRQIAKAARENIYFMWLTGSNRPDFRTINRFRSSHLKPVIDELFYSVVAVLQEMELINLDTYFLDGTKIEANANKYTWVWKKSTDRYKASLMKKVRALLIEIEEHAGKENEQYGDKDLEEMGEDAKIDSDVIEKAIREINERLSEKAEEQEKNKELEKTVKTLEEDYLPRMKKYEEQEEILGKRNSYSKTDHDATFMRMKDDHMKNGQLKPGYNVQIGTENQFIVGFSIHQNANDINCLKNHVESLEKNLGKLPKKIIADAGYGSEENYVFLDGKKIDAFVKYNYFHREQKKKFKEHPFYKENFPYDRKTDTYICPKGKRLAYAETRTRKTANGYESVEHFYEAENCKGCLMRSQCHQSQYNRRIVVRPLLEYYKTEMRMKLKSVEGRKLRSRRPIEVESVFGHIKWNRGFTRFLLRGIDKVKIEWGLLSIAHNMLKIPI